MIAVLAQRISKYTAKAMIICARCVGYAGRRDHLYFAYGANLSEDRLKSKKLNVEFLGLASAPGFRLDFNLPCEYEGQGYAGLTRSEFSTTYGALFSIDRISLMLLDIMEWVPLSFYRRSLIRIKPVNGDEVNAWAYFPVHPKADLCPSKGYHSLIVRQARELNFPVEYIAHLSSVTPRQNFKIDHSFSLMFPGRPRPFIKYLLPIYRWHDRARERLARFLP